MVDEFYFIAKIQSTGKNGFVKIQAVPGIFSILKNFRYLFLDFWNQKKKFELEDVVSNKNSIFLKFKYFDDDRDISVLPDRDIYVLNSEFNELNVDGIFENNVIGFLVFQNDKKIGFIRDFYEAPANKIIELETIDGKEILVPFVEAVIDKIDYQNKELVIKSNFGFDNDED